MYQSDIAAQWFSHFLLKAFVSRVQRRVPMRRLRFARSTIDVQIRSGFRLSRDLDYLYGCDFGRTVPALSVIVTGSMMLFLCSAVVCY